MSSQSRLEAASTPPPEPGGVALRWRVALESGSLGVWDWDVPSGHVWTSETCRALVGIEGPAGPPMDSVEAWLERVHPADHAGVLALMRGHLAGETPLYVSEHRLRCVDGSLRWFRQQGRVVRRDARGAPLRMVGTLADVDAHREALARLARAEVQHARAEGLAHVGSWAWDLRDDRLTWSAETFRIVGRDPGLFNPDLEGFLEEVVHPEDVARVRAAFLAALEAPGEAQFEVEHRVVRPGGAVRVVAEAGQVLRDDAGRAVELVGSVADVTALRAHERLLALQAARAEVLLALPCVAEASSEAGFLQRALLEAAALTDSQQGFMAFVDEVDGTVTPAAWWAGGEVGAGGASMSLVAAGGWAAVQCLRGPQVGEGGAPLPGLPAAATPAVRWALVPVIEHGQVRLLVGVGDRAEGYGPKDVETLRLLAEESWRLVSRRRDQAALQESAARYLDLFRVNPQPMWVFDRSSLRFLAVNDAAVAHYGWSRPEFLAMTIADLREPAAQAALVGSVAATPKQGLHRAGVWSHRRRDGSVIQVEITSHVVEFDGHDAELVLAHDVTERLKAEAALERSVAQLEALLTGTVEAISQLMDLRDPYTAGHQRRVGALAAAIGAGLGLDPDTVQGLSLAGLLHDVGKITLPAELLAKPTRLSAPEFALIKTHPEQGRAVLERIAFPWPVAEVAHQHHERLDGSGYPRGLRGEEILLEARIVAVADVVESMASHRPYRPSMGLEAALAEIERNAGRLYDPAVAAVCLRLFREEGLRVEGLG